MNLDAVNRMMTSAAKPMNRAGQDAAPLAFADIPIGLANVQARRIVPFTGKTSIRMETAPHDRPLAPRKDILVCCHSWHGGMGCCWYGLRCSFESHHPMTHPSPYLTLPCRSEAEVLAIRHRRRILEASLLNEGASTEMVELLATDEVAEKMLAHENGLIDFLTGLFR